MFMHGDESNLMRLLPRAVPADSPLEVPFMVEGLGAFRRVSRAERARRARMVTMPTVRRTKLVRKSEARRHTPSTLGNPFSAYLQRVKMGGRPATRNKVQGRTSLPAPMRADRWNSHYTLAAAMEERQEPLYKQGEILPVGVNNLGAVRMIEARKRSLLGPARDYPIRGFLKTAKRRTMQKLGILTASQSPIWHPQEPSYMKDVETVGFQDAPIGVLYKGKGVPNAGRHTNGFLRSALIS